MVAARQYDSHWVLKAVTQPAHKSTIATGVLQQRTSIAALVWRTLGYRCSSNRALCDDRRRGHVLRVVTGAGLRRRRQRPGWSTSSLTLHLEDAAHGAVATASSARALGGVIGTAGGGRLRRGVARDDADAAARRPTAPPADLIELSAAQLRPAVEAYVRAGPRDEEAVCELCRLKEELGRNGVRFLAALKDAEIAGWCELRRYETGGQVEDVVVLEPFRGRGLARALVCGALERLRADGCTSSSSSPTTTTR